MGAADELAARILQHAVVIELSTIDQVFIATIPDLDVHTHGETRQEAAKNAGEVIAMIIAGDAEEGVVTAAPHFSALTNLYPEREHMASR